MGADVSLALRYEKRTILEELLELVFEDDFDSYCHKEVLAFAMGSWTEDVSSVAMYLSFGDNAAKSFAFLDDFGRGYAAGLANQPPKACYSRQSHGCRMK
ncbi:MAG: hypothetical protein JWO55_708 [Candidatus Saccharibacteria bacterium]|jgi:hypothetical protein|nr:hypothetical protein [Candidatus Saccharibacteria bacterium]